MARQQKCGKCGKSIGGGSGVVIGWGADGRLCEKCQPARATLANGNEFVRKADKKWVNRSTIRYQ